MTDPMLVWPWLLTVLSWAVMLLMASPRLRAAGWAVSWLLMAPASCWYNVTTHQLGFAVGQLGYAAVSLRGWLLARREPPVARRAGGVVLVRDATRPGRPVVRVPVEVWARLVAEPSLA